MSERPPLDYNPTPLTFNDLYASALGMREREARLGPLPSREKVVVTAEAVIDLIEVVADIRGRVALLEAK